MKLKIKIISCNCKALFSAAITPFYKKKKTFLLLARSKCLC